MATNRILVISAGLLMSMGAQVWAQTDQYRRPKPEEKAAAPTAAAGNDANGAKSDAAKGVEANKNANSDKVDVTELEKKYWAPKDTDFSVVQNRTYSKQGKFAISALYGLHIDDDFSKGSAYR